MLYVIAFERLGIVLSDLYFLDPNPGPGQEGPERGVRLELRFLESGDEQGSIYASRPIVVGRPIWRVDLLESENNPGSLDRAHHHPRMNGWEPGVRKFEPELSADPLAWLEKQLGHLQQALDPSLVTDASLEADLERLRGASTEVLAVIRQLLDRVGRGELAEGADRSIGSSAHQGGLALTPGSLVGRSSNL